MITLIISTEIFLKCLSINKNAYTSFTGQRQRNAETSNLNEFSFIKKKKKSLVTGSCCCGLVVVFLKCFCFSLQFFFVIKCPDHSYIRCVY